MPMATSPSKLGNLFSRYICIIANNSAEFRSQRSLISREASTSSLPRISLSPATPSAASRAATRLSRVVTSRARVRSLTQVAPVTTAETMAVAAAAHRATTPAPAALSVYQPSRSPLSSVSLLRLSPSCERAKDRSCGRTRLINRVRRESFLSSREPEDDIQRLLLRRFGID